MIRKLLFLSILICITGLHAQLLKAEASEKPADKISKKGKMSLIETAPALYKTAKR
jgi:hypothetical protein